MHMGHFLSIMSRREYWVIGEENPRRRVSSRIRRRDHPDAHRGMYWVIGNEDPRYLSPPAYRFPNPGMHMYDRERDEYNRATTIQRYVRGRQARGGTGRAQRQRDAIALGYGGPNDDLYQEARGFAAQGMPSLYAELNHVDRMDRDDIMRIYGVPYWRREEVEYDPLWAHR